MCSTPCARLPTITLSISLPEKPDKQIGVIVFIQQAPKNRSQPRYLQAQKAVENATEIEVFELFFPEKKRKNPQTVVDCFGQSIVRTFLCCFLEYITLVYRKY